MKKMMLSLGFLISLFIKITAQEGFDAKYNLIISTVTRDAEATLFINDRTGNTFAGVLIIDGDERPVFGWYTQHKSEGGIYHYNTEGIVFYVDLKSDFQQQQLFKGIFNYDKTRISGTYFYWGNEFNFGGEKEVLEGRTNESYSQPELKLYPNPVKDRIYLDRENIDYKEFNIFSMSGEKVIGKKFNGEIIVKSIEPGVYILVLTDSKNKNYRYKFTKIEE